MDLSFLLKPIALFINRLDKRWQIFSIALLCLIIILIVIAISLSELIQSKSINLKTIFYVILFFNFIILSILLYFFSVLTKDLSDKESETRALLESTPDGIIVLNESNAIHNCNRAAGELFGCKPEQLIGEKIHSIMTLPIDRKTKKSVDQFEMLFLDSNVNEKYEATALRKDGITIPIEIIISEIKSSQERQSNICILRDILEEKQDEICANMRQAVTQILVESHNADYVIPRFFKSLVKSWGST